MADEFAPSYNPDEIGWPANIDISEVQLWNNTQINQHLFDRWSVVHAGAGVYLGWHGMGLIPLLIVHTAFEWFENEYLKEKYEGIFPSPSVDTFWNSLGDTISMVGGWALNLGDNHIENKMWGLPTFDGWRELIGGKN